MLPSNDGKKMEKYSLHSASQKKCQCSTTKKVFFLKIARDYSVKLKEIVQQQILINIQYKKTAPSQLNIFSHHN